jgi:hypothetical protein
MKERMSRAELLILKNPRPPSLPLVEIALPISPAIFLVNNVDYRWSQGSDAGGANGCSLSGEGDDSYRRMLLVQSSARTVRE